MKILVTGKNGTLGGEFARLLQGDNYETKFVDRAELDLTDEQAVENFVSEYQPNLIINCAAYNAVDKAEQEPDVANLVNGTAVGYLAAAAKKTGAKFVHYSSNYVFKGDNPAGYKEDDSTNPQSAYGKSKLLGELEALKNCSQAYVIRTAWLYGKPGSGENSKVSYVDRILQLSKEKPELQGVSDQFGQPTWTKDLAQFTLKLIDSEAPGVYHGTNSGKASWFTWGKKILELQGISTPIKENTFADFPKSGHTAARPQYGLLLCTKIEPLRPWEEALQEYLQD